MDSQNGFFFNPLKKVTSALTVREYLFSSPHCGKWRRSPLLRTLDESITWLNKFPLAAEIVECFRDEQLNFGMVWDKLICLHSDFTREAAPDWRGCGECTQFPQNSGQRCLY